MLYLADSVSPRKATRSLIERGIFTKEEFLEMVKVVEAVALTEEQKGFLFLLLKTVIDVPDQKGMES